MTRTRSAALLLLLTALSLAVAACGSSAPARSATTTTGAGASRGSGPVDVLYAGSLVSPMQNDLAPAFEAGSGYTVTGYAAGSSALAAQIKGKVRAADVFISASPKVDATLEGPANGDWVSWYATFAKAPLVLGYNPKSRFAAALRSRPWYEVVTEPGFLLGRTDPATDPKGVLAAEALRSAAAAHARPALDALAGSQAGVFPEETLVGRLQSGQLDAGFFYTSESTAAHLPTVALAGADLGATYTVTVLRGAPHPAAAQAFVAFLLGPRGRSLLERDGFHVVRPAGLSGPLSAVPASLRALVAAP